MKESCRILYQGGIGEIVEKKSRFIASVTPVSTEEEATAFITEIKKKYWDASHNCSAFTIGDSNELTRCSDDGEPAQTAGRPMLDVLLGEDVHNVCAVVTRYFGGTLLGTGGLVRAYQRAVKEGLSQSVIIDRLLGQKLLVETDYQDLGKIQYILGELGVQILESVYQVQVELALLIPFSLVPRVKEQLIDGTAGRCRLREVEQLIYGVLDKNIVLF